MEAQISKDFPAVGDRVQIVRYGKHNSSRASFEGRTGTVTRACRPGGWVGWYVELDPKPRERVRKVQLFTDNCIMRRIDTSEEST